MGMRCGQVTIPEVDNTALECDDFTLSTCVKVVQKCNKVGNLEGESLDKFIVEGLDGINVHILYAIEKALEELEKLKMEQYL